MGWVESIQRAIEYIEENIIEELSMEEISKTANASAFHFQRIFALLTDMTISDYIRKRRLTLAAYELINTAEKVIDLSFKYGYETPEAFTKAFRKQHHMTPSEARKGKGKINSYNRLAIQVSLRGVEPMNYRIVEKDSFSIVGVKKTYNHKQEENIKGIPTFWNEVHEDGTNDLLFELNTGDIKGVLGICVEDNSELMDYWIATEYNGEKVESLSSLTIPTSKWAVFEVKGAMPDAMRNVWKSIFSEWLPSNSYKHAGSPELEVYPPGNPFSPEYQSEIWIPIK